MEVTYHRDIRLPERFDLPPVGMRLRFGGHVMLRAQEKGILLPTRLPEYDLIEVTLEDDKTVKWVLRYQSWDPDWDTVLVVQANGVVRTAWLNHRLDTHRTLDRSKYAE